MPSSKDELSSLTTDHPARVFDTWRYAYPEQPAPPLVKWFAAQPSIFVGAWESLAFRRRAGLAWTDESQAYQHEFSDETLDRIAEMGCNHLILPHTKGYGLEAMTRELDRQREVIARATKRGIRVGLYLRLDSVIPEILRREHPDVDEWLTIGELGRSSFYSSAQTFRSRICLLHPSAMQYLESEIRHAVQEMGTNLLHFDGLHFSFYPSETCRCSRCTQAYRQWLEHRYPDLGKRAEMFGIVDFKTIPLPRFDPLQQATDPGFAPFRGLGDCIHSPDIQSWFRFRWDGELALMRHLRRLVHHLDPNVAVSINPAWGECYNSYRIFTSWAERLLPWVDAIWTEDPLHLRYDQGRLVSRIGAHKTAREYEIPTCSYHWMREPGRLEASLALGAAANGGHLACVGFTIRHLPHFTVGESVKRKVSKWVNDHWRLFSRTRPAGEIALLRHQPSLAWNSRSPWWAAMACEQLLVQMQVPWRMFDNLEASRLQSIKTLLLPEASCLSDEELARLESWIREGGRVLVTSGTASHNEDHRRRPKNPFATWISSAPDALEQGTDGETWFDWIEGKVATADASEIIEPTITEIGRGRIGIWPAIHSRCRQSSAFNNLGPDQWWPPEQAVELAAFINRLHGEHRVQLQAPPHVIIEHHHQSDGTDLLHLVQVDEHANPVNLVLVGPIFRDRQVRVHALDKPVPTHVLNRETLCLDGVRRYTIVELVTREQ
ncbi:MAG: beta-galactosidase [Phycisphaerales bacterium]|nr:beta-galactosidase [Phycisphaerales bacterium]